MAKQEADEEAKDLRRKVENAARDAAATEDADTADGTVEAPTAESVQDEPVPAPEAEEPALAASF